VNGFERDGPGDCLGCLLGREFREILERGNVARWDGNRMGGKLAVRKFHFSGVQVAEHPYAGSRLQESMNERAELGESTTVCC
jgi:hypothetical protein